MEWLDLVVSYLSAWVLAKARRVGDRADTASWLACPGIFSERRAALATVSAHRIR